MREVIDLTRDLISIPSVSGNEKEALEYSGEWMKRSGIQLIEQNDVYTCGVVPARGPAIAKRALIMCGHVDTVSPGEVSDWRRSPWESYVEGERLYGLGVGDMKAGVAIQLMLAKEAITKGLDYDLWVSLVANEEVDGTGARAFTDYFARNHQYTEANCIIAEPTDNERIEIGHRGNRFVEFVFRGEAGHASQEDNYGISAIPPSVTFLEKIAQIRHDMHERYTDVRLGRTSFTPTRLGGSETYSINKTSDKTTVSVDVRTTPQLDDEFEVWVNTVAEEYGCEWRYEGGSVPSALCADDAAILSAAKKATGLSTIVISPGATDQAFFQAKGIDTVVYGPGDFDLAHTTNESASLKKIEAAYGQYERIIDTY